MQNKGRASNESLRGIGSEGFQLRLRYLNFTQKKKKKKKNSLAFAEGVFAKSNIYETIFAWYFEPFLNSQRRIVAISTIRVLSNLKASKNLHDKSVFEKPLYAYGFFSLIRTVRQRLF